MDGIVLQCLASRQCEPLNAGLQGASAQAASDSLAATWEHIEVSFLRGDAEDRAVAMRITQSLLQKALANLQLELAQKLLPHLLSGLRDLHCVLPCAEMLCEQIVSGKYPAKLQLFQSPDLVSQLWSAVCEPTFNLQAYGQRTRVAVLRIYQAFTLEQAVLLNKLTHPVVFISGVLQGIHQERDPRNLLITFDLMRFIADTYLQSETLALLSDDQASQYAEELFDAISCYFPINFSPPKNDTMRVAPETLRSMLADAIVASPRLAPIFVTFLLDRITAQSDQTKCQALELLTQLNRKFNLDEESRGQQLSQVSNLYFNYNSGSQLEDVRTVTTRPHPLQSISDIIARCSIKSDILKQKNVFQQTLQLYRLGTS